MYQNVFFYTYVVSSLYIVLKMIICIHKKDELQITAKNKQQSPNLRIYTKVLFFSLYNPYCVEGYQSS